MFEGEKVSVESVEPQRTSFAPLTMLIALPVGGVFLILLLISMIGG